MPQNNDDNDPMPATRASAYKERLNSWAIARLLPNNQRTIVARFRSRSDADGHVQCLRQIMPDASFEVVFDRQQDMERVINSPQL
jgi:hypothetical protein